MTNTKCTNIKENLSAHLDNALDAEQSNIIEEHLQSCEECTKELDELKEIVSLLSGTQNVKIPDSFDFGIMQTLHHEKAKKSYMFKRKITMISSIAAVFVIGIFSITMYNYMSGSNNDANLNYIMPQPAIMADMSSDMAGGAAGNGALSETEEARQMPNRYLRLYDADVQRILYRDSFGTVIPYGTQRQTGEALPSLWHGQQLTDEYGEPLGLTNDHREEATYALQLVYEFLHKQYHLGNINILIADGNVKIEFQYDEVENLHIVNVVLFAELINGGVTMHEYVLHVRDGKVTIESYTESHLSVVLDQDSILRSIMYPD